MLFVGNPTLPALTSDATEAAFWAWGDHVDGDHSGNVIGFLGNSNSKGNDTTWFLGVYRNDSWPHQVYEEAITTGTLWTGFNTQSPLLKLIQPHI